MAIAKNILVTGGAGFMGSDFIKLLLNKPEFTGNVVNLDLLTYAGNLENLKEIEGNERYTFIKGDICDAPLVEDIFREYEIGIVVHFAAETHVDRSIDQPKTFIETNIVGTYTLLEAIRRHPEVYLHLISTDEVYGDLPTLEGHFTEESSYKPSSPYAASKAAADHLALSYVRTYGVEVTVSHASNNFGPNQHKEKLIPRMIHLCLTGEPLTVYGSGEQVRDWIFVRDHSEGVFKVLQNGKRGEVYNIAGGHERTNMEVIHHIIDRVAPLMGKDKESLRKQIIHVADRPGHDFRYALDTKKMREDLNWNPKMHFDEGLDKVIREAAKDV